MTEIEELIAAIKAVQALKKIAEKHELAIAELREELILIKAQLGTTATVLPTVAGS